jgi:hypothetical protein
MLRPLLLAALAASVAYAAPAAKGPEASWFPTKEGATLVYETRVGGQVRGTYTDVVTKVETKDGALHVTVTHDRPGAPPAAATVAVTAEGVFRVADNGEAREKLLPILKTPPKVGTKWEGSGGQYEVTKEEEVEVPAGKFKAVRVETTAGGRATLWFAPAVGLVKVVSGKGDVVQILKEFKPGK